jgi:hypothetical protein
MKLLSATSLAVLESIPEGGGQIAAVDDGDQYAARTAKNLVSTGFLERKIIYTLTPKGRQARDESRVILGMRAGHGEVVRDLDTTNMPKALPWHRHPPVTDPAAVAAIEDESRSSGLVG